MVDVAFAALIAGGLRSGAMAVPAGVNARDQDIRRAGTRERLRVAGRTLDQLMSTVIEVAVLQPAGRDPRFRDLGLLRVRTERDGVALTAGLAPKQPFGFLRTPFHPFHIRARHGRLGPARNSCPVIRIRSQLLRVRHNVLLERVYDKCVHLLRILVGRRTGDPLIKR